MAGVTIELFCEVCLGTHHVKATNVGHILWQVYLDMLGTYSVKGMKVYTRLVSGITGNI